MGILTPDQADIEKIGLMMAGVGTALTAEAAVSLGEQGGNDAA